MPELTQTVSPLGGGPSTTTNGSTGGVASRPMISQTFEPGGDRAQAKSEGGGPTIEQTVTQGGGTGKLLGESTRKLLANLDKYGSVHGPKPGQETAEKTDSPPAASGPGAAGAAAQTASQPGNSSGISAPDAAAVAPAKPAEPPPAPDEHRERADRFEAANRRLIAENERLKSAPKAEPDKRTKALRAAADAYWDDPVGGYRQFVAAIHDLDDPKHADIDAEMSGFYKDLTARELNVPLDKADKAERETARTRQLLARQERERKAELAASQQPQETEEARQTREHTAIVANVLTGKNTEGKSLGDAHPLTMKLAERLYGMKPEALILAKVREGLQTGEYEDVRNDDRKLIERAARDVETHYQDLAKLFGAAIPATSTAPAPTPQTATANQDAGQTKAAPTITNASASVAPATPPAKQETKPVDQDFRKRRPGETEDARRRRIANHHFGDS